MCDMFAFEFADQAREYTDHDADISITDSFRARERAEKVSIACVRSNLLRHSTSDLDSNIYAVYAVLKLAGLETGAGRL